MISQGFPYSDKGWGGGVKSEILMGGIFVPGGENLRSKFDDLNLFQS